MSGHTLRRNSVSIREWRQCGLVFQSVERHAVDASDGSGIRELAVSGVDLMLDDSDAFSSVPRTWPRHRSGIGIASKTAT